MKDYKEFLSLYKKVADKILEQKIPLDAVNIIETELPVIHNLSIKTETYIF